ncbi:MAG: DUF1080 domain-containing protein [Pirellulales bacterium]
MLPRLGFCLGLLTAAPAVVGSPARADGPWTDLFTGQDSLEGWTVTDWSDLKKPPPDGARWEVVDGRLLGSTPRGTWLVSKAQYADFELEFEWRLGPRGNSGVALHSPRFGDPAFDGLELQMVDPRYFPAEQTPQPSELTGSFYRAVAPRVQVFKPEAWNRYEITCRGPHIKVKLNGELIHDLNLDEQTKRPLRHDGSEAPPLVDRPRRGHIGFQELSRGGGRVEIRAARIRVLD